MHTMAVTVLAASLGLAAAATTTPLRYTIHADEVTNPAVNRRWLGCHSDPGMARILRYAHVA